MQSPVDLSDRPNKPPNLPLDTHLAEAHLTHDSPFVPENPEPVEGDFTTNVPFDEQRSPSVSAEPRMEVDVGRRKSAAARIVEGMVGIPIEIAMKIMDKIYCNVVYPKLAEINRYKAWSEATYGEALPDLIELFVNLAQLDSEKLFMDLGSGVGNVVLQVALRSGCTSFGIEKEEVRALVAEEALSVATKMAKDYGYSTGEVELIHGDIIEEPRVKDLIRKADLVFVNNVRFPPTCKSIPLWERYPKSFLRLANKIVLVNNQIGLLLRYLKAGARVITLEPLGVSARGGRAAARDPEALGSIMSVSRRPYEKNSCSWKDSGGQFYLHVMQGTREDGPRGRW